MEGLNKLLADSSGGKFNRGFDFIKQIVGQIVDEGEGITDVLLF